jgi:hypothetical protein
MSRRLEVETPHGANLKHTFDMNEATTTVPPAPHEINLSEKDIARFWRKVNKDGPTMPHMESPCWLWMAAKNKKGYGYLGLGKKTPLAHRVCWTIVNGQIPHDGSAHGICVCHRCDNPACINPAHLFLGTNADNVRDMAAKGRQPRGDKNGARLYPERIKRGEENGNSKLTAAIVIDIRARYAAGGITQYQLATLFNLSQGHINDVIQRKRWRHI